MEEMVRSLDILQEQLRALNKEIGVVSIKICEIDRMPILDYFNSRQHQLKRAELARQKCHLQDKVWEVHQKIVSLSGRIAQASTPSTAL